MIIRDYEVGALFAVSKLEQCGFALSCTSSSRIMAKVRHRQGIKERRSMIRVSMSGFASVRLAAFSALKTVVMKLFIAALPYGGS